jgi:hypothetical protein
LETLKQKEKEEGQFQAIKGVIDKRGDTARDMQLNQGFDVDCGLKGSKLSGGQK